MCFTPFLVSLIASMETPTLTDICKQTLVSASDEFPRNMGADIIELKDGRLFLAFSQWYTGADDTDDSQIMGMTSDDSGAQWSQPFPVSLPFDDVKTLRMPSMISRNDGTIIMLMRCRTSITEAWVGMSCCRDETLIGSDKAAWTQPVLASPPPPGRHIALNNRLVRLNSGRLLLAVSSPWPWDRSDVEGNNIRAWCLLSDDDAETWHVSSDIITGPGRGAMEPYVVELQDERLLMLIRTDTGYQYRSISEDGGDTWSVPVTQPDLVSVQSPCAVRRDPRSGCLFIVWNHGQPGTHAHDRSPLTVGWSDDDGTSWQIMADLEDDTKCDYSYPSINFIAERTYVTYYVRRDRQLSLKMQSFVIEH